MPLFLRFQQIIQAKEIRETVIFSLELDGMIVSEKIEKKNAPMKDRYKNSHLIKCLCLDC